MKSLLAALLLIATAALAAEPQSGVEFSMTAQPIPVENPAKIEVTEIFWYGCPHCYLMEPAVAAWLKKLPKDVEFKRVPGLPHQAWAPMAKAFYAMESLGVLDKLHSGLFDAIHRQKVLKPNDEAATIDWIAKQGGLDRKKVEDTFNSFSVNTKVMRAAQIFRASGASGVPSFIVEGRYLTSSTMAGGNDEALKVVDYLIEKTRSELTSGKR